MRRRGVARHLAKEKNILLVHRYYWPDSPPYASILRKIAKEWNKREGVNIDVFSSFPSYKKGVEYPSVSQNEVMDDVHIFRCKLIKEKGRSWIALINMVLFCLLLLRHVIKKGRRYDLIMISTSPPILSGVSGLLASKVCGAKFVYHCMDIHPEAGLVGGSFRLTPIYRLALYVDTITCINADRVIVLSSDMKDSLYSRRGYKKKNIEIINNPELPDYSGEKNSEEVDLWAGFEDCLKIIFAGNIGRFQGLESFVEALHLINSDVNVSFLFMGEGARLEALKSKAVGLKEGRIRFVPHQSVSVAKKAILGADLGVVSLSRDVYRYAYPSKVVTYLSLGCPLMVSVEKNSELACLVQNQFIGVHVEPGDPRDIAKKIEAIFLNRNRLSLYKKNAKEIGRMEFGDDKFSNRWASFLEDILR